jgi:hypothetical protein
MAPFLFLVCLVMAVQFLDGPRRREAAGRHATRQESRSRLLVGARTAGTARSLLNPAIHRHCAPEVGAEQNINRLFRQRELKGAIVLIAKQFVVHVS